MRFCSKIKHMEENKPLIKKAFVVVGVFLGVAYLATLGVVSSMFDNKMLALKEENKLLSEKVEKLAEGYAELREKPSEVVRREVVRETSQDELLTQAVAKVAKSVVSITVSKNVPELEVVYINPFGNDPFFQDFGIRVPQYQQKGTTLKQVGAGTGFVVSASGYILTNKHVIDDDPTATYTVLLSDGTQKEAKLMYKDPEIDIALLKAEPGKYAPIVLGNSDQLKLGQSVFAVGNALGEYSNSVSVGIISGLNRDIEAFGGNKTEKLKGVIQTDAAINPGNSGGPLVDFSGRVVGVNVAMDKGAENIGFAIPINAVKSIINTQVK